MIVGVTTHVCCLKKQLLRCQISCHSVRFHQFSCKPLFLRCTHTYRMTLASLDPKNFLSFLVVNVSMYLRKSLWSVSEWQFDSIISLDVVCVCGYVCIMHRSQRVKMILYVCVWENFPVCALMRRPPLCVASSGSSLQPAWKWPNERCLFGQR